MSSPGELCLSLIAALINNLLFVYGLYLTVSGSSSVNGHHREAFLIRSSLLVTAWGLVNFLLGGLDELARYIANGKFDTFLATPRHSLLLVATFNNPVVIMSLAELLQGLAVAGYLGYQQGWSLTVKLLLATLPSAVALLSVLIIAGTLAFFVQSGQELALAVSRLTLLTSLFPIGDHLNGWEQGLIYSTPVLLSARLPLQFIRTGSPLCLAVALGGSILLLLGAVAFFNLGRQRYQMANWIGLT